MTARFFMLAQRVEVVGAELGFQERQRLLAELEGVGEAAEDVCNSLARSIMLESVSGWSRAAAFGEDRTGRLELLGRELRVAQARERRLPSVTRNRASMSGWFVKLFSTNGRAASRAWRRVTSWPKPSVFPLRPGGGEDLLLHELEHRLRLDFPLLGLLLRLFFGRRGGQGLLLIALCQFALFGLGLAAPARHAQGPTSCRRCRPISTSKTTALASTGPLFLLANLRKRYHAEGGQACTGSSSRYRRRSAARPLAVS